MKVQTHIKDFLENLSAYFKGLVLVLFFSNYIEKYGVKIV